MHKGFFKEETYNEILFETDNFIVIPSLGSMVEGWLLIIPKKEYLNLSTMFSIELDEVEYIVHSLNNYLLKTYGEYVLFEHGPMSKQSLAGCGVDYAHLHIVPCKYDLISGLRDFLAINPKWEKLHSLRELKKYKSTELDYLFIQDQQGNRKISLHENLPSQSLRKVIAYYLDKNIEFDWKKYPQLDTIAVTINTFKQNQLIDGSVRR